MRKVECGGRDGGSGGRTGRGGGRGGCWGRGRCRGHGKAGHEGRGGSGSAGRGRGRGNHGVAGPGKDLGVGVRGDRSALGGKGDGTGRGGRRGGGTLSATASATAFAAASTATAAAAAATLDAAPAARAAATEAAAAAFAVAEASAATAAATTAAAAATMAASSKPVAPFPCAARHSLCKSRREGHHRVCRDALRRLVRRGWRTRSEAQSGLARRPPDACPRACAEERTSNLHPGGGGSNPGGRNCVLPGSSRAPCVGERRRSLSSAPRAAARSEASPSDHRGARPPAGSPCRVHRAPVCPRSPASLP